MYPPVVDVTKSWLAINPIIGCNLGCRYCFRVQWSIGENPIRIYTPQESVEALLKHPCFEMGRTPIAINICGTDPFLPESKDTTFECLQLLDSRGISNIVGLTTKFGLLERDIQLLESYRNIKVVIVVSYAALPERIEPFPAKRRLDTLRLLSASHIPSILYFRPIVEGWNDDEGTMQRVLSAGQEYSHAIAIGGLRLSARIRKVLEAADVTVPYSSTRFNYKVMPRRLLEKVRRSYLECGITKPLFIRTRCAVGYVSKSHYKISGIHSIDCSKDCSTSEIRMCYGCNGGKLL